MSFWAKTEFSQAQNSGARKEHRAAPACITRLDFRGHTPVSGDTFHSGTGSMSGKGDCCLIEKTDHVGDANDDSGDSPQSSLRQ